ncbi:MAG TPA: hypothetical protein VES20_03170, partial [Bryobacteraceae bacterium]|nr:hypothetical protein [Bryobacteraceae bacterium]
MDPRAENLALNRLRIFARIIFVWAVVIVLRLIQLQVVDHSHYQRLAENQQQRTLELPARRGTITDRNGMPLAISVPVESVCINPLKVKDSTIAARILSNVLKLDENQLLSRITTAKEAGRGFLWIERKVTDEEAARLRAHQLEWLEFRGESTRSYPKGELAAHLLGGVDFQERGNAGIEQSMDELLRG